MNKMIMQPQNMITKNQNLIYSEMLSMKETKNVEEDLMKKQKFSHLISSSEIIKQQDYVVKNNLTGGII